LSSAARLRLAQLLIVITPAIWSTNYIVARAAPGVIEPHLLAFLRWLIAFGLMLPLAWSELRTLWPEWRREWKDLLLLGALGMWICGAFVYIGGETTEAINIGLIYAIAPVLIAVVSARLFADRLRGWQIVGLVMAVTGVVFIISRGSLQKLLAVDFTRGDIWIIVAVMSWTAYSILLRSRPSCLGTFARLTAICGFGLLVLAPFTVVEWVVTSPPTDWSRALFISAMAGVLPGFGAYQAYSFMQKELGAARTGLVLYLGPIYTALIAWWLLSEPPMWFHGVGTLLILPGMYLAMREQK
jgi:drug/metabolite transporter (DMT)-like permease